VAHHFCLFCDNDADSKEDVLPVWAQEKLKGKVPIMVNGFSGDRPIVMQGMKPNLATRCVCTQCNNGWMSQLEGESLSVIGPLMEDIQFTLNGDQQSTLVSWAVKTAMTGESFNRKTRKLFYTRDECKQFRESRQVPAHTLVWLGRYCGFYNLGIFGIDGWDKHPRESQVTHAYTTTITLGRVVFQIVSLHPRRNLSQINLVRAPGPWEQSLLDLRPSSKGLFWPPPLSFDDGVVLPLKALVERFSGEAIMTRPLRPDE
jgi:hypothetical protein